jgi:hypothetical protein
MANKKSVKPAQRRPPRRTPPLTEKDVLFCHLILKGLPAPKATQLDRIEASGERLGYSKAEASRMYHREPVQLYLEKYRDRMMTQMVREEVRSLRRQGYMRDDVLEVLHEIATMPPERTRGSIAGQVSAATAMGTIMGLVAFPRNPDDLFKGRTEEELAHFAVHGSFATPRVN